MKTIRWTVLFAAALCFSNYVLAQTAAEVKTKFNEAATAYQAKKMQEAIPLFEKTIEMANASSEDVVEVLENSQKYLANAYLTVGANQAKAGQLDQALATLIKAEDLGDIANQTVKMRAGTMISTIYIMQGSELLKAEKFQEAADICNKAVERNNKDTKNALLAAQCYSKAGNAEKATELYKMVIELGKTHSKYEEDATKAKQAFASDLLQDATKAEKYEDVKANFDKVMQLDSANAQAYLVLIQSANNFKKFDEVIANADQAAQLQSDDELKSTIYFLLGVAYQTKEDKAKAIEAYKKVVAGSNVEAAKAQVEALSK